MQIFKNLPGEHALGPLKSRLWCLNCLKLNLSKKLHLAPCNGVARNSDGGGGGGGGGANFIVPTAKKTLQEIISYHNASFRSGSRKFWWWYEIKLMLTKYKDVRPEKGVNKTQARRERGEAEGVTVRGLGVQNCQV